MTAETGISTLPRATLRLQMNKHFTFARARAQIPYFAQLGISHLYLSPILTARAGSMHGYDVIDHGAVNPELGGETEFRALVAALRQQRMGIIVDIVPNHMAVGGSDNKLWLDVLEWGSESRYADFFDIDWDVPDPALKNRLLAPFLGKSYGEALRDGEIVLQFDSERGRFAFYYFEHCFPLAPPTYAQLLRLGGEHLGAHAQAFRDAQQHTVIHGAQFAECCANLAHANRTERTTHATLQALLHRVNAQDSSPENNDRTLLHSLLQRQHYRLASWRTASDEINWRRFFDVIQLAGVRVQAPAAFDIVHATTLRLYAEGLIDGVRVDHIDGLAYPRDYCYRLRTQLKKLASARPESAANGPAYFIVEKILAPEERLPRDWHVDGTTGYSFMNEVSALLHDPGGANELAECWADVSGRADDFNAEMKRARRRILRDILPAEFGACAYALHKIARDDIATRDWSLFAIRRTLAELLIQFPIYRTYADAGGRSAADNDIMQQTKADALPECRPSDAPLLDHIDNWLGREAPRHLTARSQRQLRLRAIARFQQLSAPLAAKAVEDTAFYRYSKLLSRNEVGANPSQFALTPDDFHRELSRRAAYFPRALLATATHDHKRGEDIRARLAVLSEVPARWHEHVRRWRALNAGHKIDGHGKEERSWPQPTDEYMLYQMLVGGWPLALQPSDQIGLQALRDRLAQWLLKALREAKSVTSWTEPNTAYESACKYFLYQLFDTRLSAAFIDSLFQFVNSIAAAGALNSLTQLLLKLAVPGIPDIYQGCEWWDFSFADPDNRSPVDFAARAATLQNNETLAQAMPHWRDGQIKQKLLQHLLMLRAREPDLFAQGDYRPLIVHGEKCAQVFAFSRSYRRKHLIVIVPLLAAPLTAQNEPCIAPAQWGNTAIAVPYVLAKLKWTDELINREVSLGTQRLLLRDVLPVLPFAVLNTSDC